MIGTANIDLTPLFKGEKIDKQFLIKDSKNWDCGSITVQILIKDWKVLRKAWEVNYSPEFEDEFIFKVCMELVKQLKNPTFEIVFDELSRWRDAIDVEDFLLAITKWYWVDVSESEIKCFVEKSSCFGGRRFISRENYIKYFTTPFNLALK